VEDAVTDYNDVATSRITVAQMYYRSAIRVTQSGFSEIFLGQSAIKIASAPACPAAMSEYE